MPHEPTNPTTESETTTSADPVLINMIVKILREQYIPYVKEAVQELEVLTKKRSKRAIYELRDALDHIAIAVQEDTPNEVALKSIDAVEEHLRRATIEPAEFLTLAKLDQLLHIKQRGFWWWKLFGVKPPDTKEFDEKILKGQKLLSKGRYYKGISLKNSYTNLKEAFEIFRKLLNEIQPAELRSKICAVVWSIAIAGIFFILGKIL
jgi:hypothetical protein